MYVVYAIYNEMCDKIYIGQTENLSRRLEAHNTHTLGGFTSRFPGVWNVIYSESVPDRSAALMRERQLKSAKGREFIRKHIPR